MATASISTTRDLFLWCMSVIYLFAFTSLFVQIPGLYGDNGVLPAKLVLQEDAESYHDLVNRQPTLLRLLPKIGFDVQTGLDFLCLGGAILAFVAMISRDQRNCVVFTALWTFYLSVFQVGQAFLWFQWDVLLLEVGFLTILVAPVNFFGLHDAKWHHAHDRIAFWLVRWLLFRLTFASGVAKLTGEDRASWWSLAAVGQHFETQYLPTPISWYFHQLPDWLHRLGAVGVLTAQLIVSMFILSPIRHHRLFAFYSQVLTVTLMTLTGNYGFFTLLVLTLSLSLVDDDWLSSWTGQFLKGREASDEVIELGRWIEPIQKAFGLASYVALAASIAHFFSLDAKSSPSRIESSIGFDSDQFESFVRLAVMFTTVIGAISLVWQIVSSTIGSYRSKKLKSNQRTTEVLGCVTLAVIAAFIFVLSLVPHADVNEKTQLIVPDSLRNIQSLTSKQYQLINSYYFSTKTTEDDVDGRLEVVLEGSYSLQTGWREYNFRFKPGDVSSRLPIASPHQPRLDFQMWFAARRSYKQNYWMLNLAYRLLTQQEEVLQLVGENPFADHPPKYIKASLYIYHYTSNSKDSDSYSDVNWWTRERVGDYLPVVSLEEPSFIEYVQQAGLQASDAEDVASSDDADAEQQLKPSTTIAKTATGYVRSLFGQGNGSCICLLLVISGFLLTLLDPSVGLFKVAVTERADGTAHAVNNNCVK